VHAPFTTVDDDLLAVLDDGHGIDEWRRPTLDELVARTRLTTAQR
jgi:hypothetical protein